MDHMLTINKLSGLSNLKHVEFISETGLFLVHSVVYITSEVVSIVRHKSATKRVTCYS
jgi:hypothetical protein